LKWGRCGGSATMERSRPGCIMGRGIESWRFRGEGNDGFLMSSLVVRTWVAALMAFGRGLEHGRTKHKRIASRNVETLVVGGNRTGGKQVVLSRITKKKIRRNGPA